jgi:2-methylisocitrate lyase-like PEP mutase family enzyme
MTTQKQRQLARTFRARHGEGPIVVLPNAFDAASARIFARHDPPAIGTTSGGIAWSAGYPDGEQISRHEMLDAVARIVRAVEIGVSADVEAGYGDRPEDAAATAQGVIDSGAIGLNLEDGGNPHGPFAGTLLEPVQAAAKIAAVREVADREDIELVINARTDVFLVGAGEDDRERIALSVERGNAYLDAGADCVFVPGAAAPDAIEALVAGVRGPLNIYALPGVPDVADLERLGVARVSVGGGPYQACLALIEEIAAGLLVEGSYEPFLSRQLAFADVQELFVARARLA